MAYWRVKRILPTGEVELGRQYKEESKAILACELSSQVEYSLVGFDSEWIVVREEK